MLTAFAILSLFPLLEPKALKASVSILCCKKAQRSHLSELQSFQYAFVEVMPDVSMLSVSKRLHGCNLNPSSQRMLI